MNELNLNQTWSDDDGGDDDDDDDDNDDDIQSECMAGRDGNMAADVSDGATHPLLPTISKMTTQG